MRNNLLTVSRISLVIVFASMFAFSMNALWNIRIGIMAFDISWPWLPCLLVSAVGILFLVGDLK